MTFLRQFAVPRSWKQCLALVKSKSLGRHLSSAETAVVRDNSRAAYKSVKRLITKLFTSGPPTSSRCPTLFHISTPLTNFQRRTNILLTKKPNCSNIVSVRIRRSICHRDLTRAYLPIRCGSTSMRSLTWRRTRRRRGDEETRRRGQRASASIVGVYSTYVAWKKAKRNGERGRINREKRAKKNRKGRENRQREREREGERSERCLRAADWLPLSFA